MINDKRLSFSFQIHNHHNHAPASRGIRSSTIARKPDIILASVFASTLFLLLASLSVNDLLSLLMADLGFYLFDLNSCRCNPTIDLPGSTSLTCDRFLETGYELFLHYCIAKNLEFRILSNFTVYNYCLKLDCRKFETETKQKMFCKMYRSGDMGKQLLASLFFKMTAKGLHCFPYFDS